MPGPAHQQSLHYRRDYARESQGNPWRHALEHAFTRSGETTRNSDRTRRLPPDVVPTLPAKGSPSTRLHKLPAPTFALSHRQSLTLRELAGSRPNSRGRGAEARRVMSPPSSSASTQLHPRWSWSTQDTKSRLSGLIQRQLGSSSKQGWNAPRDATRRPTRSSASP